ncbi:unnamed protein product [Clonostachys byssicola]|uniref:AB hydrolase-1 domain-containing protein n=1 Tax=Clonostachys byssicola TaxID=160290 RepID=A0A9N9UFV2_9HYPO|nr:unnamed protein product [Clonostachys byssicola]
MSMDDKPAIVLFSGGWHTPETYSKLTKALAAAGLDVHCPRNPSTHQIRPPTSSLAQDSENMRSYVSNLIDGGRRVVALGHSYGGQVMTNSLHGLGVDARKEKSLVGGVTDLIYLCAFALEEGGSCVYNPTSLLPSVSLTLAPSIVFSKVKEMGHEELMPLAFDFAGDMTVLARDPRSQLVGQHYDDAEVEEYLNSLVLWNGQCMYDKIEHCAWREIPITYVYTLNDMTVPLDYQKSMVAAMEAAGRVLKTHELATGHCPNLTATKVVVSICAEVVEGRKL